MSMIETINDVNNTFLSRREITCNFKGIAGKLKKLEASDMIAKQFKLEGKVIIPISMKSHSGKPDVVGTFYVYDNEELAKKQVNETIFKRLEKAKAAQAAVEKTEAAPQETKTSEKPEEKKEEVKA
jgi:ribosomal protein S24E